MPAGNKEEQETGTREINTSQHNRAKRRSWKQRGEDSRVQNDVRARKLWIKNKCYAECRRALLSSPRGNDTPFTATTHAKLKPEFGEHVNPLTVSGAKLELYA